MLVFIRSFFGGLEDGDVSNFWLPLLKTPETLKPVLGTIWVLI